MQQALVPPSAMSTATKSSNELPTIAEPVTSVKSSIDLNAYKTEKLHELYMEAWEKMRNFDVNNLFVDKVTDAMAPGYSTTIKKPMYLNLIRNKIEESKYSSLDQMQDDVHLTFDNCILWNTEEAEISKVALEGKELWDKNYEVNKSKEVNIVVMETVESPEGEVPLDMEKSATNTAAKPSNKLPSTSTAEPVTSVKSSIDLNAYKTEKLHELCMEAWEKMRNFDVNNLFVDKVTDAMALGYSNIIKHPMYLNLIRSKIEENKYSSLDQIQDDVHLMFDNCVLYNGAKAAISKVAMKGKELWDKNYKIYKSKSNVVPAPSGVISKIAKRKRHTEEDEIVEVPESKAEVLVKKEQADQKILKRSKIEEQQRDSKPSTAAALSNESMDVDFAEKVEDKKSHTSPVTKLSPAKKLKRNNCAASTTISTIVTERVPEESEATSVVVPAVLVSTSTTYH